MLKRKPFVQPEDETINTNRIKHFAEHHTCLECGHNHMNIRKSLNYRTSPNRCNFLPVDTPHWKFECRNCRAGFHAVTLKG